MSIKYQRMMRNLNAELLLNRPLDFQQARVAEFHHAFCLNINEMVVLSELVGTLVLCAVVPKLVLDDQAALQQQIDSII